MKYLSILLAITAGSALVSAAPSKTKPHRPDPSIWQMYGECHAKVCEIEALGAIPCKKHCSKDGNFCGVRTHDVSGFAVCK